MVEEAGGWFVRNVRDAMWIENAQFGKKARFESPEQRFPGTGITLAVLEPGKPACRYHRESAQEDFLVLSGHCKVLVNDEEIELGPWDYLHCPPGVTHVFVGAGDGPCTVLMIGDRPDPHELFYPASEKARAYGAESPEPTSDPRVAYRDVDRPALCDPPEWPPAG